MYICLHLPSVAWVGRVRCLGCDLEVGTQCPTRHLTLPPALLPQASGERRDLGH